MRLRLLAALLFALPVAVHAQPRTAPDTTLAARARAADAAERHPAAGWFWSGFLLGVPTGAGLLFALGEADDFPAYGAYVGLPAIALTVAGASGSDVTMPAAERARVAGADSAYRQLFEQTYVQRVRAKRKRRTIQGALAGTVTGAAALLGFALLVFSAMDT